ncbi:DUF4256 domain-containing protein, partial [Candidatus Peregrinibacteria bacterium]|nr:DUF4256 domain-containing protein [Candidatus Peregrinibacteria bacterium]
SWQKTAKTPKKSTKKSSLWAQKNLEIKKISKNHHADADTLFFSMSLIVFFLKFHSVKIMCYRDNFDFCPIFSQVIHISAPQMTTVALFNNNLIFMASADQERRREHAQDEESLGFAARALREGVSVDSLDLRLVNRDGSVGPDAGRENELRSGAREKLLAVVGNVTESAGKRVQNNVEAEGGSQEKTLSAKQKAALFTTFETRFTAGPERYKDIQWPAVKAALEAADESVLFGLLKMEENGHEVGVSEVEKDGKKGYRFDSCSALSPSGVRDVDYFRAEEIAEEEWGVPLMSPDVAGELKKAGIITEKGTWSHLKTDGETLKNGLSWYVSAFGVFKRDAYHRYLNGGFRCSLWVPAV